MKPRLTTLAAHIGRRLRKRRIELALLPSALAARSGGDPADIEKYERGDEHIPAEVLMALSKALDVEPVYFFEGMERTVLRHEAPEHFPAPVPETRELASLFSQIEDTSARQLILQLVAACRPGR